MGRIIAAIEIGSMWMGYAYSLKDDWKKVLSSCWASEEIISYKAPSCILLHKDFSTSWIGYEAEDKYAELISEDSHHDYFFFQRFQTNLHQNSDLNQCYDIESQSLEAGLVFKHCIKCLKEHLTRTLEQNSIGYQNDDIGYILTVPLICGEKGKMFLRNAAIKAGIIEKHLTIVFEHEAASVYCWTFANPSFDEIKTGSKYLIAVLGGETADIMMFKTDEDNILEEVITSRTGPWGGKSVDDQFEKFLSELVEEKVWETFKRKHTDDYLKIMRNFETNKRTIGPNKSGNIQIPIPPALVKLSIESQGVSTFKDIVKKKDDAHKNNLDFASGKLIFSDEFFRVFYKKSIGAILKSIDEVIHETKRREVKTIFLTGGLSECLFVQESIKKIDWNATIIVPDDAGLAILKGAVYLGHFPDALSLKSTIYTPRSRTNLRFPETTMISELPPPITKRDYCIKELHDTEKNYVDVLRMIHLQFNKPLKDIISKADRDVIFAHIEKLLEIHQKFQAELQSACISGKPKIGEVFVKYKKSLLLYGNYCSDMPKAQERLEEVTRKNENIRTQIEACEQRTTDGNFKLMDLLEITMKRFLNFPLLLRALIEQSGKQAEDKDSLEEGMEAMMDLILYVNEVKRDNETVQLIEEIQASIEDIEMPANTTLKDYGRLQMNGELNVKNHTDNKIRIRYIFLFDKAMLMCKAKRKSYSFKEAIILALYKVQDQQTANRETQRRGDKLNSSFIMGKKDGSNTFSFFVKTEAIKAKWIDAIKLAQENASPPQGINYVMHTFDQPTECSVCRKLLKGVFFQGYKCTDQGSDIAVHKECIGKQPNTGSRTPPIPVQVIGQVRALCNYTGNPNPGGGRPALRFQKDDVIKLLNNDAQWWKGLLNGDEGWFPSQLVQEIENRIRRKPSYLDVKIRSRTENGTPNTMVDDDRSSDQLSVYNWFVGPMSRDTANHTLEHMRNGTFLIRVSENPGRKGELSLSIRYDNQVRHIRVEKNAEGLFYLADTKFFSSLPELVEFNQENSLADSFPGVDTTLKFPFKTQSGGGANTRILGYAEAVYDYAATATSQLSLCRGDKVAILSKTGSDKGWWKGEHCISGKNGCFPLAYVRELDDD